MSKRHKQVVKCHKLVKKVTKSEKRSQTCKKSDKKWVTSVQMLETSEKMSQKVTN